MKTTVSKFDTAFLRPVTMLCKSFKFEPPNRSEKEAVNERHGRAGSGRVGPIHFKNRIKTFFINKFFSRIDV